MTSIDKQTSRAASAITPSLESNHLESSGKSPPRHNRDVHKKVPMVVVIDAGTAERKPERRRFGTVASELRRLCAWLQEQGVEEAVMESTAQYWRPVWLELEPFVRLHLAQAFSNRAPLGRKHDFKDAERYVG